jgi:ABC-type Fe3+-hydroxamate transport system substrate-binding protein
MSEDTTPTRRDTLKYGGSLAAAGLLAGCADSSGAGGTPTATSESGSESYTGTLAPMGELTLEEPPSSWVGGLGFTADVLTALGHADGAVGMADPRFWYTGFYEFLDGVSVPEPDSLEQITTEGRDTDLEVLYELEPDLLAVDPNLLLSIYGLDEDEAEEVQDNIAPWFGNNSRRKRFDGWVNWPSGEPYDYVQIPEYVEQYGSLFGEQERAGRLLDRYEPFIEDIRSRVPDEGDRRSMALVNGRYNPENRDGWIVYNPVSPVENTWGKKQYRDLGVVDAFEGAYDGESAVTVDYEGLLEYDPDVIIFNFGITYRDFEGENYIQQQRDLLADDPVGSQISAVQTDDLYVGGTPYQGPIINMFQTEMAAKQLYPSDFGAYPGYGALSESEQLFDREALAAIINGESL